jgi:hypothetical protein
MLLANKGRKAHRTDACSYCSKLFGESVWSWYFHAERGKCSICEGDSRYLVKIPELTEAGITRLCGSCERNILFILGYDLRVCAVGKSVDVVQMAVIVHLTDVVFQMIKTGIKEGRK